MKILKYILMLLLLSSPCYAEDLYYAQAQAGDHSGSSCANAIALSAIQWGDGAGKVSAADTAHLCGTLTSPLVIGASGTAGNVITILFEAGAKFSAATWTQNLGNESGVITLTSKSYITIDGGSNGTIEATANGHGLANQNDWIGIYSSGGSNVTIKDLSILNMNVRASDDDSLAYCNGVFFANVGSNNTVQDCTITYAWAGVYAYFSGALKTGLTVSGNTFSYVAKGLVFGDGAAGATFSTLVFDGNTVDGGSVWFDTPDAIHGDGIHIFAVNGGGAGIDTVTIRNNTFGSDIGAHCSNQIRFEGTITTILIYNNVLVQGAACTTDGALIASGDAGIYNNTFVGNGTACTAITMRAGTTGWVVENNIIDDLGHAIYWDGVAPTYTSDYNIIYSSETDSTEGAHSKTSDPDLDGSYKPQAGSPAINAGVQLNSIFTTDKAAVTRGDVWDIGAIEYGADVEPNYTLTLTIVGTGTVTSSPSGIDSSVPTMTYDFDDDTVVTLTAVSGSGYWFSGWSGSCSGTALTAEVTMSEARACTATFRANTVTLGSGGTATIGAGGTATLSP